MATATLWRRGRYVNWYGTRHGLALALKRDAPAGEDLPFDLKTKTHFLIEAINQLGV